MTMTSATQNGTLYVIATPIGNKGDITFRALETLKTVDVILAEDTRHSITLLNFFGIKKPLESLHDYNEKDKAEVIVAKLKDGISYALISDAGTPLISDPGYNLVKLAHENKIKVVPIPGACAFIAALSAAGVPCDAISFFGFLPAKSTARIKKLESVQSIANTLVFYESTHRILQSIEDIALVFGHNCEMVLAKELTKSFENLIFGTVLDIKKWLSEDSAHIKGEFVLIISPRNLVEDASKDIETLKILLKELPLKQAVKIAVALTGKSKNELYQKALEIEGA
jgi:16S rRNA (cytidine1402-2'-O)-methyltransferase